MNGYNWRTLEELGASAGIAAGVSVLQALVTFDPSRVTDWRTWAVALGAAALRAASQAALGWIGAKKLAQSGVASAA